MEKSTEMYNVAVGLSDRFTDAAARWLRLHISSFAVHPMVYILFVFDQAILDGASVDAFRVKVKDALENWT